MSFRHTRERARIALACALLLSLAACGGGETPETNTNSGADAQANSSTANAAPGDASKLDGEIERLEKQAQRNPGDDETRSQLASAYVRRANSLREARQLKEALADYQRALRTNPDNEEAQKNSAELAPLVEGTPQEGEYGDPPPPPITPNVIGGEASPTPTPKKQ
ncbi:MAG TPA: tetratricopeptide repeat protein [Pyrinomonadaceae bacterium]|nr:tetratricopeptide repeat protein [Pyrinomonadaceae bacterium]